MGVVTRMVGVRGFLLLSVFPVEMAIVWVYTCGPSTFARSKFRGGGEGGGGDVVKDATQLLALEYQVRTGDAGVGMGWDGMGDVPF